MTYYDSPAFWTRDEIRAVTDCPLCGASKGAACIYIGKGSARAMRLAKNHEARMWRAQDILRGIPPAQYRSHPSIPKLTAPRAVVQ